MPLRFDIFTLFPAMFEGPFSESILHRALNHGLIQIALHDIRHWATDRHAVTDEPPYGGGGGMVMKAEPLFRAVEEILAVPPRSAHQPGSEPPCPIVLMTPQGRPFSQQVAAELARQPRLALLCGRYEGVDERVRAHLVTDEISLGDFVLSGGELAAMVVVDAVTRLLPGALGDPTGASDDSHATGLLEYPHYTRPATFRGWAIPETLAGGNHGRIEQWRRQQAMLRTRARRPDMLGRAPLSDEERRWLAAQPHPATRGGEFATVPTRRAELLARMRAAFDSLERTLALLSEDEARRAGADGAWAVQQVVAHLAFWQEWLLARIVAARAGPPTEGDMAEGEVAAHNMQAAAAALHQPWPETLAHFRQASRALMKAVRALSENALFEAGHFPALGAQPLWQSVASASYEHLDEHRRTLEQWLAAQGHPRFAAPRGA